MDDKKEQLEELMRAIDRLSEEYATDENGNFDLVAYLSFRTGFQRGVSVMIELLQEMQQKRPDN